MSFDTIHNFYESLVIQRIVETLSTRAEAADAEYLADIACVALNHLPPRYIRHDVDMSFYLSPLERSEIAGKVDEAIEIAVRFIAQHRQSTK